MHNPKINTILIVPKLSKQTTIKLLLIVLDSFLDKTINKTKKITFIKLLL